MWVNGVNEANTSHTRPINELNNDRTIGQYVGDRWEGNIDELVFFNSTLTDAEIKDYYNYTKTFYNASFDVKNIPSGEYIWNCIAYDSYGHHDWGDSNWTVTVDTGEVEDCWSYLAAIREYYIPTGCNCYCADTVEAIFDLNDCVCWES
jgi:hypothetical protein